MDSSASRFKLISNHLSGRKAPEPVSSSVDFCFFDDLLTQEEIKLRKDVREFCEKEILPIINEYVERAEFPECIVPKIAEKDWYKLFVKKPYGEDKNAMLLGLITLELSRVDAGVATFFLVHAGLFLYTLDQFASDEQKKKWFPDMLKLKMMGGWGLTEPLVGSDAASLQTKAKKVEGGYVINGAKRWIGSANRGNIVTWARNEETKKVECFFVPTSTTGVKVNVIKNKLALRIVQNCDITFENAFVPEANKLPGADKGFASVNQVLEHSRIFVAWIAVGVAVGVYDNVIKYVNQRTQFGVKLTSFQLTQEKLARMMGHIQAMLLMVWRVTRLYEAKKFTIAKAAMAKAWTSMMLREVAKLGREMMGGNGIIIDNYAMKALADAEAIYTYEGTYDVNSLVVGRELTGVSAFK